VVAGKLRRGQRPFGVLESLVLLDQVRAVDKTRLAKKLGVVSAKTLTATLRTLQEVFAE